MKDEKSVVFGRERRGYTVSRNEKAKDKGGRRRISTGVEDFVMLVGSFVIVAYFALTLAGGMTSGSDYNDSRDAVSVSVTVQDGKYEKDEKWSFWEYLSECLEQIFTEKGLV